MARNMATGARHESRLRKKTPAFMINHMVLERLTGNEGNFDRAKIHSTIWYQRFNKEAGQIEKQFAGILNGDQVERSFKAWSIREVYKFMNDHFGFGSSTKANAAHNAVELIIIERGWE